MNEWMNEWFHFSFESVSMFPDSWGKRVNPLICSCESLDNILQCVEQFRAHWFWWSPRGHSSLGEKCLPATLFEGRTQVLRTCKTIHSGSSWIETKNSSLQIFLSVRQVIEQICIFSHACSEGGKCYLSREHKVESVSVQRRYLGRNR